MYANNRHKQSSRISLMALAMSALFCLLSCAAFAQSATIYPTEKLIYHLRDVKSQVKANSVDTSLPSKVHLSCAEKWILGKLHAAEENDEEMTVSLLDWMLDPESKSKFSRKEEIDMRKIRDRDNSTRDLTSKNVPEVTVAIPIPDYVTNSISPTFLKALLTDNFGSYAASDKKFAERNAIDKHSLINIRFAVIDKPLKIEGEEVTHEVALFKTHIKGDLKGESTAFVSTGREPNDENMLGCGATFREIKVDGSVYFDDAVFAGPVNFINAFIDGDFTAHA